MLDSKEPVTAVPAECVMRERFSAALTVFFVNRNTADASLLRPIGESLTAQAHQGESLSRRPA